MFDKEYYINKKARIEQKFQALKDSSLDKYFGLTNQASAVLNDFRTRQQEYAEEINEVDNIINENTMENDETAVEETIAAPEADTEDVEQPV